MPKENERHTLRSKEVWGWPEFKLFCERAGIELNLNTKSLTIQMDCDSALTVIQTYLPKGIPSGQNKGDES